MKNMKKLIFFLLAGLLAVAACKKDKKTDPNACNTDNVSFSNDIMPIMNQSCAVSGCHDAATHSANVQLNDYDHVRLNAVLSLQAITHQQGVKPMPYPPGSDPLSDCDIAKFSKWIADGMPNN